MPVLVGLAAVGAVVALSRRGNPKQRAAAQNAAIQTRALALRDAALQSGDTAGAVEIGRTAANVQRTYEDIYGPPQAGMNGLAEFVRVSRKPWLPEYQRTPPGLGAVPMRSMGVRALSRLQRRLVRRSIHETRLPSGEVAVTLDMSPRRQARYNRAQRLLKKRGALSPSPLNTAQSYGSDVLLGDLGADTPATEYAITMRAVDVPVSDGGFKTRLSAGHWQAQLDAQGMGQFRVQSVKFVRSIPKPIGWLSTDAKMDEVFEVTVQVPGGGRGIGSLGDILDTALDALRRIGRFLSRAFDVVIEKVVKIRDVAISTGKGAVSIFTDIPKSLATTGGLFLLAGAVAVAGVIYVAGKSKTKTAYARFGD